jgi:hypothetical protein
VLEIMSAIVSAESSAYEPNLLSIPEPTRYTQRKPIDNFGKKVISL